ncbi:MAG: energy-coupling factor ABC transporter permease [Thermodesulfobacteriota bacterium]
MHMADALLSPTVGTAFWAGSVTVLGYASKKLQKNLDDRNIPLMGVLGAFIFAAQMINFTIPGTGSSGHLGGGLLLAVLLGPWAAFLVMASVLSVQALFFADGGLLALGCNIWNLGIYPCFLAYPLIYRPLVGASNNPGRVLLASLLAAVIGLQLGAFSVVLQTLLSGKSELPFATFALLMQPIHLAIGLVEGAVTAGVLKAVHAMRPDLLVAAPGRTAPGLGRLLTMLAAITLLTGGILSWFASSQPDGLEWSIEKVAGTPELTGPETGLPASLKEIQEKTAIMPDYAFKGAESAEAGGGSAWPAVDSGTSTAGLLGGLIVLGLVLLVGLGIRTLRRQPA